MDDVTVIFIIDFCRIITHFTEKTIFLIDKRLDKLYSIDDMVTL